MSDELRSEITAYQLCVLDDSMGEGPHALLSREATRSPRSSPAWWSGTFRLTQNLRLAEQASVAGDSKLAFFYEKHHLLGQQNIRLYKRGQQKKQSKKSLNELVYRLGDYSLVDCSGFDALVDAGSNISAVAQNSSVKAMQLEYMSSIFKPGVIVTVPAGSAADHGDNMDSALNMSASGLGSTAPSCNLRAFVVVSRNTHTPEKLLARSRPWCFGEVTCRLRSKT